jgi:hypothetical protein
MSYNYWCKNTECREKCDFCNSKGDLQIEEKGDYTCPQSSEITLKLMGETVSGKIGPKMTVPEIRKDRVKRSSEDFQKNVLPTFKPNSIEGKHFAKKYPKSKKFFQ